MSSKIQIVAVNFDNSGTSNVDALTKRVLISRFVLLLVRLRLVYFAYSTQRDGTQQKRLSACCLNLVHFTRKAKIGGGVKGEGGLGDVLLNRLDKDGHDG